MKIPLTGNGGKGSTPREVVRSVYEKNFTNAIPEKKKVPYFFNVDIPTKEVLDLLGLFLDDNKNLVCATTDKILGYYRKDINKEYIQIHIDKALDVLNSHGQEEYYFELKEGSNGMWYIYCYTDNDVFASFKYNSVGWINVEPNIEYVLKTK